MMDRAEVWFYRIGGYLLINLLINLLDDPAWLALSEFGLYFVNY